MPINLTITTSNELITKDGGYHEIHNIKFLNSPEHALSTILNVIENNQRYTDENCPLDSVDIRCTDIATYKMLDEMLGKKHGIYLSYEPD